jgi:hypothetical protein
VAADYISENWCTAVVDFKQESYYITVPEVLNGILVKIATNDPGCKLTEQQRDNIQSKSALLNRLVRLILSQGAPFLLLFDSVDKISIRLANELKEELAHLYKRLTQLVRPGVEFKCLAAGRRIADAWAQGGSQGHVEYIHLGAFTRHVVQKELDQICRRVGQIPNSSGGMECIVSRLLYLSGGHPKLIVRALKKLDIFDAILNPTTFMWEAFDQDLSSAYSEMIDEIPKEVREIFQKLSVLRFYNAGLLDQFGRRSDFIPEPYESGLKVFEILTKHRLIEPNELAKMYTDGIYRRVLLNYARDNGLNVTALHANAYKIYELWLREHRKCLIFGRHLFIEAFYHYVCSSNGSDNLLSMLRQNLSCLVWYYEDSDLVDIVRSIKRLLNHDYELQEELRMIIGEDDFLGEEVFPMLDRVIRDSDYRAFLRESDPREPNVGKGDN